MFMKSWRIGILGGFAGLLLAGCATTTASSPRFFHEASSANAVLQFNSWDYTFLTQPRYEENGFLLPVARQHFNQVLDRMQIQKRNLAVVVTAWDFSPEKQRELVTEWNSLLRGCGFDRVVLIKSRRTKELNGALILDDSSQTPAPSLTGL